MLVFLINQGWNKNTETHGLLHRPLLACEATAFEKERIRVAITSSVSRQLVSPIIMQIHLSLLL